MSCELCGGGDMWIKTCCTTEGAILLVCDECYAEHASVLVIVPGDRTVTARCDHCWRYGNPREFAEIRPRRSQERLLGDVPGVRGGGASRPARRGRPLGPSAELPLCLIVEVELVGLYLL
jgi:ribosome-binding protein aMBF1 (putative translation factor)